MYNTKTLANCKEFSYQCLHCETHDHVLTDTSKARYKWSETLVFVSDNFHDYENASKNQVRVNLSVCIRYGFLATTKSPAYKPIVI